MTVSNERSCCAKKAAAATNVGSDYLDLYIATEAIPLYIDSTVRVEIYGSADIV